MSETESFREWAILELMGHRRLAGVVTEAPLAGGAFVRIDVYTEGDAPIATQYYSPGAVYCITPTTEELARRISRKEQPAPVSHWDLQSSAEALNRGREIEDRSGELDLEDDDP